MNKVSIEIDLDRLRLRMHYSGDYIAAFGVLSEDRGMIVAVKEGCQHRYVGDFVPYESRDTWVPVRDLSFKVPFELKEEEFGTKVYKDTHGCKVQLSTLKDERRCYLGQYSEGDGVWISLHFKPEEIIGYWSEEEV